MSSQVMPLHYVTVEFWLRDENQANGSIGTSGQHRFLYGVESWIDGVDQQLAGLEEGEYLQLILEPDAAAFVASQLLPQGELSNIDRSLALQLKIVQVVKAEPREVVKALAATVSCCDHCGGH